MVRAAVVAACKGTGESAEDCLGKVTGIRARHYAMHALTHVCGRALRGRTAAELVGCPADGRHFHRNSMSQVAGIVPTGPRAGLRLAKWWDERIYGCTIAAIDKMPRPPADPPPNSSIRRPGRKLSRQVTIDETPGRIMRCGGDNIDKMFSRWHDPDGSIEERIRSKAKELPRSETPQPKQSQAKPEPEQGAWKDALEGALSENKTSGSRLPTGRTVDAGEAKRDASPAPVIKHKPNFATAVFRHSTPARAPGYERDAYRPTHNNAPFIRYAKSDEAELRKAVLNSGGRLVEKPGESGE